jgi:hypothetical protein
MISERSSDITSLIARARSRWRTMTALRAWTVGALLAAVALGASLFAHRLLQPEGAALVLLWTTAAGVVLAVLATSMAPLRRAPRDLQMARFIEERCPELEDALVTAVAHDSPRPGTMAAAVVRDAADRARRIDLDLVVSRRVLRRAAIVAAAATAAFAAAMGFSAGPARGAARIAGVYLFPARLALEVTPGDVRIRAGESLRIVARTAGQRVVPVLLVRDGDARRESRMEAGPDGFAVTIDGVDHDFHYHVTAAGASTREFAVTVLRPPRVERIDLRYEYPQGFGMAPRAEEDGGDIYGPAGTRVQVTIHTDKPVQSAALTLTGGQPVVLSPRGGEMVGELTITGDGSYRVALADGDGLTNPGETEYFIRTLQDRPPDVRIIRPASDRQVTPVEEVSIEAAADDDFGVEALDLVYSVRGGAEQVVPFDRRGSGTAVTGSRMLYLEDLGVRPGDFVAYYARARDVGRGRRSTEARSDIFFLEVTPFEQELKAADSQGMGAGGGDNEQSLEELIQGQKEIVTATWNLDRRGRESGVRSEDDVRAVGRAQRDLRSRTQTLLGQMQRASNVRRRQPGGRGGAAQPDAMAEAVGRAAQSMESAQRELEAIRTSAAIPSELTALNELLHAQAEVRQRQIQQQASGNGGRGANRQQQDMSSLFDRELAQQQQTNYESPASRETRDERAGDEAADQIQDLARRQDELSQREQGVARRRGSMTPDDLRRELERLTREQTELRRQAEELAREVQQGQQSQQGQQGQQGQRGQQGQQSQQGQGRQQGQQQGQPQGQQPGQQAGGGRGGGSAGDRQQASRDLQQAAEEMQAAAGELRRDNPQQASERGSRAADRLRDVEQRMRGSQPDDRRRALGEMQLESRQLADAQRRLGQDGAGREGGDRADRARRRAGEQERLAERAERLDQSVRTLARDGEADSLREQTALDEAVRELDRSGTAERMRDAARAERQVADGGGANTGGGRGRDQTGRGRQPLTPRESEEIARGLERLAERLGAAGAQDGQSDQASQELARLRELREDLAQLDRQLGELRGRGGDPNGQGARGRGGRQSADGQGAEGGRSGQNVEAAGTWQDARDLLGELHEFGAVPDVEGFNPGQSAPGTEPWKQDFARWDELKQQAAAALERAERTAADRLREQQSRDRLNAGASESVPEQYRKLVERYYRALAGGK